MHNLKTCVFATFPGGACIALKPPSQLSPPERGPGKGDYLRTAELRFRTARPHSVHIFETPIGYAQCLHTPLRVRSHPRIENGVDQSNQSISPNTRVLNRNPGQSGRNGKKRIIFSRSSLSQRIPNRNESSSATPGSSITNVPKLRQGQPQSTVIRSSMLVSPAL